MFRKPASFIIALTFLLISCESNPPMDQTVGTLGGAAAGGAVGSQIGKGGGEAAAIDVGILLGAWIGDRISVLLDRDDRIKDQQAERRAYTAPVGREITWNNPEHETSGTIVPVHDGYNNSGAYCRDFQQTVLINYQEIKGHTKACQQPDGSWKVAQ